jgi:GTP pyrophosphokinase
LENKLIEYKKYLEEIQGIENVLLFEKAWQSILPVDSTREERLNEVLDILVSELNTFSNTLISAVFIVGTEKLPEKKYILDHFSESIWRIIEGSNNIKNLKTDKARSQPDFHRQLILSVSNDMRAVLIQLAIHLQKLRNFDAIKDLESKNQLLNLMDAVYIPIAHRLGFYKMKSEMEDLVLQKREPEIYFGIKQKLIESEKQRQEIIREFLEPIVDELNKHKLAFHIKSRLKSINSIFMKMKNQDIPFEKVFDLWAIRIILNSETKMEKADCWHAYSVVTNTYKPNLSRLRDWITVPKSTGYESLHVTVEDTYKRDVEVQIRTNRMDDEAENGLAAHWKYKGGKISSGIDEWLTLIRKVIQEEGIVSGTFEAKGAKPLANEIFVFTPQGDLKKLNLGATVLDFAYNIHTDIGSHCTNALVNGKIVPIKHVLKNGDQIQIITSKNQKPNADWLKFVVSNRTKIRIRKALDEERLNEIKRGKEILERRFKNWKMELSQEVIAKLVDHFKFKQIHDLFLNVSLEKLDPLQLKKVLLDETHDVENEEINIVREGNVSNEIQEEKLEKSSSEILVVDQIDHIHYKFARCCNPIPGDAIFGFVTVTKGITIHRKSCSNAKSMKERFPYRIILATWKSQKQKLDFKTSISIQGIDEVGLLNRVTQVISNDLRINILSSKFQTVGSNFSGQIKVFVHDLEQLDLLIDKLKKVHGIEHVYRKD